MSAELFLNTLFHNKPEKEYLLIWQKGKEKKLSYWFDHVSDAIKHFNTHGQKQDTYIGCGTSAKALPAHRRCKAEEISGIPAAWIDVDVLNPTAHQKLNLPETNQRALEVIEPFPLKPTIIVHSGHGYQFWWVFKQFGKINNARDHEAAADLLHHFTWTMRDCARSMGYDLDMTFDLSRVFRIPGGKNFKDNPPLPITLESCTQNYYSPVEFRDALNAFRVNLGDDATPIGERKKISLPSATVVQGEIFKLDPNADPPKDKFEALMTFEPKFSASWERRRKDFKSGDESASAYDLSLASFAYGAGWSDQEVVDLLIAFRRVNGLPQKLVEQYYRRTLKAASNALENQKAFEELEIIVFDRSLSIKDPNKRAEIVTKAKEILEKIIKIKVRRVLKYMVDPPEYKLETEGACIHLGGIQNLIDQIYLKRKIADAVGVYMPSVETKKWRHVAQALLNLCEEVSAGDDTSNKGMIRHWLRHFLDQFKPLYNMTDGCIAHKPFYHRDSLYIFGPDLRNYVAMFWKELINSKTMGIMLKEYGFTPLTLNIKKEKGYVSRSVWKIEISKDKIAQEFVDWDLLNNANKLLLEAQMLKDQEAVDNLQ